jgi:signal transduction histidine kinase
VLAAESDGTIWAGTAGEGLFQLKSGRLTAINSTSGLADNLISSLLVDNEGKLWVGTESALNRLQRRDLFVFSQNEGLGYGAVRSLAEVAPGVIWAIKPNDGLYRWEGGNFNRLTAAGLSPRDPALGALLVARDRSCWVACRGGLLRFKDPQAVADESRLFALSNFTIISLAEDSRGNVWAGTREGQLWRLSAGKWTERKDFAQSSPVTAIVSMPDGSMWTGTDGSGLYRLRQENWSHFGKRNGLQSDSIRTLYGGSRNTLWIGTANGGLSRWRDGDIVTFTSREGLPDDTVLEIAEDEAGRLWLGGDRGIACISRHDLDELNAERTSTLYPRVYGKADGMLSEECATGFFPSGLRTKSGLVWFSTLKGTVVVDPRHLPAVGPPPVAVIEDVLVDGTFVSGLNIGRDTTFRIPPGRHSVEIQYTGPSFNAPEQTHFRYQLRDWDADWIDAGSRRTAFYNYVPPGKYQFQVTAGNSEGVWNGMGATVELLVDRYFWQAWWVIALAALGALTFVGAGVRLVEKRKLHRRLKRLEQERALERERTRIAQDLHDEMGAKLCRISFLSEHARRSGSARGELGEQITSISDAARDVLHSLDEIVWAVNPQNDTLEHVASYLGQYAQDYFQLTGIECEVDLPAQLPAHAVSSQTRHHLFLAVHEAFTNVLKHSGATRSKVVISCSDSELKISIGDNGSGMNGSSFRSDREASVSAAGDGLFNMRQRMADIGGDCRIESQPGQGTRVQFTFPLNGNKSSGL